MAAEHLGQVEWLKLTGCILGVFEGVAGKHKLFVCIVDGRAWLFVGKRVGDFGKSERGRLLYMSGQRIRVWSLWMWF